jgi:hypothetical protein
MGATIALVGAGVVGERISKRLEVVAPGTRVVALDTRLTRAREIARCDLVILAHPGPHAPLVAELLACGTSVVSIGDTIDDVRAMLDLDRAASTAGRTVVVGAGMSPGLTGLLARMLADRLEVCDEIHVAAHGTAGPACARQHHMALGGRAIGFHDGDWLMRRSGAGRELCWFPEPVGAYDCYNAEMSEPLLLHEAFPQIARISARMSATRRDRFTARLPMLSPPNREGGVGAVRVEVRGTDIDGGRVTLIVGIAELVGTAAAATATAFAREVVRGDVPTGVVTPGDGRLDTIGLLNVVERLGVRVQEFTGIPHT